MGLPSLRAEEGQDPAQELRYVLGVVQRWARLMAASNYTHIPGKLRIHHTK